MRDRSRSKRNRHLFPHLHVRAALYTSMVKTHIHFSPQLCVWVAFWLLRPSLGLRLTHALLCGRAAERAAPRTASRNSYAHEVSRSLEVSKVRTPTNIRPTRSRALEGANATIPAANSGPTQSVHSGFHNERAAPRILQRRHAHRRQAERSVPRELRAEEQTCCATIRTRLRRQWATPWQPFSMPEPIYTHRHMP